MRKLDLPDQSWSIDDPSDTPEPSVDDTDNRSFHYGKSAK
jgi:hypothetical protein